MKYRERRLQNQPNAYAMAVFTAALAGLFSVIGTYFTAYFHAKHVITETVRIPGAGLRGVS
jgi:hypothetical protein